MISLLLGKHPVFYRSLLILKYCVGSERDMAPNLSWSDQDLLISSEVDVEGFVPSVVRSSGVDVEGFLSYRSELIPQKSLTISSKQSTMQMSTNAPSACKVWYLQFVSAAGSIGTSLSTAGLITSLSNVINAWSAINTSECSWFEVVQVVEVLSALESNISGSVKVSLSGGGEESSLSNRAIFWSGEGAESSLSQRTKSPGSPHGQIFEVNPYAVALLTILVVCSDAQTEF